MPTMYITGWPGISFMSSPAFYLARVLEKIRMVLCLSTEICSKRVMFMFHATEMKSL
jgi:hypothetical protein